MKALIPLLFFALVAPVLAGDYHYIQTPQRMDTEELFDEIEEGKERGKVVLIKLDDVRPSKEDLENKVSYFSGEIPLSDGEKLEYKCKSGGYRSVWNSRGSIWFVVTKNGDGLQLDAMSSSKPR